MNKRLKKCMRCISTMLLCLLLPWNIILCCGPSLSSDEQRFALFRIGLDGNAGLKPFSYSQSLFSISESDKQPDYKRNCREWVAYTGNQATEKDVFTIQYKTSPLPFLEAYKRNNWTSYKGNSFVTWLTTKENRSALEYMAIAKQAESVDFPEPDPWDTTVEVRKKEIAALPTLRINA